MTQWLVARAPHDDNPTFEAVRRLIEDDRESGIPLDALRWLVKDHCHNLLEFNVVPVEDIIDALVNLAVEYV